MPHQEPLRGIEASSVVNCPVVKLRLPCLQSVNGKTEKPPLASQRLRPKAEV